MICGSSSFIFLNPELDNYDYGIVFLFVCFDQTLRKRGRVRNFRQPLQAERIVEIVCKIARVSVLFCESQHVQVNTLVKISVRVCAGMCCLTGKWSLSLQIAHIVCASRLLSDKSLFSALIVYQSPQLLLSFCHCSVLLHTFL